MPYYIRDPNFDNPPHLPGEVGAVGATDFGPTRRAPAPTLRWIGRDSNPDPREDPESRSPNLGPYTTKGAL